jgi:uncharacterized protein (TIGR03437 family)
VIHTVPPGIPVGQREGLSAGDLDSIDRLYGVIPGGTTITTIPQGLRIVVDGETYVAPRTFNWGPGSTHTIAAEQRQGVQPRFSFARWTDGEAISHSITASDSRTVYAAVFSAEHRVETGIASGAGSVEVYPPSADGYYPAGTTVLIRATPAAGQQFLSWSGSSLAREGFGAGDAAPRVDLYRSLTLLANFTSQPVTTIDSDPPGLVVRVDGVDRLTPARFLWQPGSEHTLEVESPQNIFSLDTEYRFESWEDGALPAARTIAAGAQSSRYLARFRTRYFLTLDWTGSGRLSTTPLSDDGFFDAGTIVTVNSVPGLGRTVQYWLGDTLGGGESKTLLMDRERAAYAVFGTPVSFRPLHAASYSANPIFDEPGTVVAPLEILTLFGENLGPQTLVSGRVEGGKVTTEIQGTQVLFDGVPAPILYASAGQTSVVVPEAVAGRSSTVISVLRNGVLIGFASAQVQKTLPGIFTANASGSGPIAAVNQDGSLNSSTRPAAIGSVGVFYATGAGLMDKALADGAVSGLDLARPQVHVYVRIGGKPAEILYAGSAPGLVFGAVQVNFRIPGNLLPGETPIQLILGEYASPPGTTFFVQ